MNPSSPGEVTRLLQKWQEPEARDRLFAAIYPSLKRAAETRMRWERPDHTLQPTALVNELYLQLAKLENAGWRNRFHFLAVASEAMRRILVDCARSRGTQKRGRGTTTRLEPGMDLPSSPSSLEEVMEVDELLGQLADHNERVAKVVELRYFGGLTLEEIAEILGVNSRTIRRDWQYGLAWFKRATRRVGHGSGPLEPDQTTG